MLDARRLRVLREVARHGSLSGAARALDYNDERDVDRALDALTG